MLDQNSEPKEQVSISDVLKCWGKTDPSAVDPQVFSPVLFHMIDVAHVAQLLLGATCSPKWMKIFTRLYPTGECCISSFIPFFVALHDIGKISASFQRINVQQYERLKHEHFLFGRSKELFHTQVSRNFIRYEWPSDPEYVLAEENRKLLSEVSAGHHGEFISAGGLNSVRLQLRMEEPPDWKQLRLTAFTVLAKLFAGVPIFQIPIPFNISAAAMALTGFTTLCDWIGSDQRFFVLSPGTDLDTYIGFSKSRAEQAVAQDGFLYELNRDTPTAFSSLFPLLKPRPLQFAIDKIPDELLTEPVLVTIEAPTGEGKTEAALALAHRITQLYGFDEFYYALPTTATSNQMHGRVQNYLNEQLKINIGVKLIHGQAFLQQDAQPIRPLTNGEDPVRDVLLLDWFNTKKRALLAPFGVGTIDQIELGALNVRHSSLRLTALSGKVIILDEVHAYDTYMTTIVTRLLEWLRSLGTSVILLSATLPDKKRKELLSVFHGEEGIQNIPMDYPLIIVAGPQTLYVDNPAAMQPQRHIKIDFLHFSDAENAEKAKWLVDQVSEGGVICWITNTVNRAQEIFQQVYSTVTSDVEVCLLHARFPLAQREDLEKMIVDKVGPQKEHRPSKVIVIGTQVLEQSLDLDFDLMVSDLAPVDLLLQRAGRLHRHSTTTNRGKHSKPVLYVNAPMIDDLPVLTIDKYVYAEYFLWRTWEVIKGLSQLVLPADFRTLVKEVYDENPVDMTVEQKEAYDALKQKEELARQEASIRLMPGPDPDDLFTSVAARLVFTESETEAGWRIAQTRLGERSLNLIPLEDHGDFCTLPGSDQPFNKRMAASREDQFQMLRHQLRISNPQQVVDALERQKENLPELFTASALLRDVIPLWLKNSKAELETSKGRYALMLDPQMGLTINEKGE